MNKFIWIVMRGSYDDYSVHSVWSTEDLAVRAAEKLNKMSDTNYAEYFETKIDKYIKSLDHNEKRAYLIIVGKNGYIHYLSKINDFLEEETFVCNKEADLYTCQCRANTEREATKICKEKLAEYLANNP